VKLLRIALVVGLMGASYSLGALNSDLKWQAKLRALELPEGMVPNVWVYPDPDPEWNDKHITQAFDMVASRDRAGIVNFSPGYFYLRGALTLPSGISLKGFGQDATILIQGDNDESIRCDNRTIDIR
jgi:hypothetical protein